MMNPPHRWIVTADGRRATLFSCRSVPGGHIHVDPDDSIQNEWENSHEHQRPTLMGGSERRGSIGRSSAAAAPHSVSQGHTSEEEQERFAREVSTWLGRNVKSKETGRVCVFAAPHFLGLLRAQVGDSDALEFYEGELTHLRPSELATHPAVVSALTRPRLAE
jgi:protein required for attachment to host cells